MAQAGRAVIDRQGEADAGASGVDLDALFSLPGKGKCALTHHPQAGGGTACGSRAFGRGCPADANNFMAGLFKGFGTLSQQAKTDFRRLRRKSILSICGNKRTADFFILGLDTYLQVCELGRALQ